LKPSALESPDDFAEYIESLPEQYDENFWRDQDHYVEVWIEKASLISVFEPVCKYYNIRLEAFGGQWSDSKIVDSSDDSTAARPIEGPSTRSK